MVQSLSHVCFQETQTQNKEGPAANRINHPPAPAYHNGYLGSTTRNCVGKQVHPGYEITLLSGKKCTR